MPSAVDILHPGRIAVLFEGSERAVDAQLTAARGLVGGDETGPEAWEESRMRQGAARGRVHFDPGLLAQTLASLPKAIVRPAAGIAYVPHDVPEDMPDGVRRLNEAIRQEFDPSGVLAA